MLWAVTSYYNPSCSRRRRANYRVFRERLGVPLLTVEWSPEGRFELGDGDAELLVQVRGGDLMWQKECLLNLGVGRLPPSCEFVAWLDCDVVFERDDWPQEAAARLGDAVVVQLFAEVVNLAREPFEALARREPFEHCQAEFSRIAIARALDRPPSRTVFPAPSDSGESQSGLPSYGLAWAARRDFLARHPLFDACIVGGADSVYLISAAGQFERAAQRQRFTPMQREYMAPAAARLADAVRGRIDAVRAGLLLRWHGQLAQRIYRTRFELLQAPGYDPARFLARTDAGVWAWADVAPGLPEAIRAYFAGRREDGDEFDQVSPA